MPAFTPPANAFTITATFKHLAINKSGTSHRLHVYIEGDGLPFKNRFQITQDPSPSNPLLLKLMSLDSNTSLYLGRPCYFTRSLTALHDAQCNPGLWTTARYSEDVVNSMVEALRQYLSLHPAMGITLIGHSGGGAIAMLMAARMSEVDQVVTLAGNVDTRAWTRLHHYAPLKESLNPASLSVHSLPEKQIHIGGDKDDMVPPALGHEFLNRIGQHMMIIRDADHNCCWLRHWADVLTQINQQMNPKPPLNK
ncbi:MAG: hypothetical protein EOO68_20665 [Moraxellaceae bacterium]|nr:MAG: hypothetical protein EOO68_20665 [Moraxellaceae bacterium]